MTTTVQNDDIKKFATDLQARVADLEQKDKAFLEKTEILHKDVGHRLTKTHLELAKAVAVTAQDEVQSLAMIQALDQELLETLDN